MAKKKTEMPVVAPPTVDEVVAESAAIADVVAAAAETTLAIQARCSHPEFVESPIGVGQMCVDCGKAAIAKDSGADSNEGGAVLPEQTTTFAVEDWIVGTMGDLAEDAPIAGPVIVGSVEARGPVVPYADLRALRATIDTLVFGCDSQRTRQDAAAPAIAILDRLIGA